MDTIRLCIISFGVASLLSLCVVLIVCFKIKGN
jgi:hypothetical protein